MAIPKGFDVDNPQCPQCSGEMWDNQNSKRSARAPDFKCKDKGCDGAVWLTPPGGGSGNRTGGARGGARPAPAPRPAAAPAPAALGRQMTDAETWLDTTAVLVKGLAAVIVEATLNGPAPINADALATEVMSTVRTFWMGYEHGAYRVGAQPAAPAAAKAEAAPTGAGDSQAGFEDVPFYQSAILQQKTIVGVQALQDQIMREMPEGEPKALLLVECLKHKRTITQQQPA